MIEVVKGQRRDVSCGVDLGGAEGAASDRKMEGTRPGTDWSVKDIV